jgi:uncharacterized RDD family membrane protein YckC
VAGRPGYRWLVSDRRPAGAPATGQTAGSDESADSGYPGQRFGLPEEGSRSVAGVGRRLGALILDWLACMVISLAIFRVQVWTLAFFAGESWLLTALTGFTLGKRLLGIRVARLDGKPVGLFRALVRTVLLLLVVPPLVFDRDLRGLHDRAAGTIVLRT